MNVLIAERFLLEGCLPEYGNVKNVMLRELEEHISPGSKMVVYKCIDCQKEVKSETVKKRVRCPYCGSKILYKPRTVSSITEAV